MQGLGFLTVRDLGRHSVDSLWPKLVWNGPLALGKLEEDQVNGNLCDRRRSRLAVMRWGVAEG